MTDCIWWDNPLGQKFWEVNQELIKRGISIQRVFILPEVPTPKHLQVIQEQLNSRIEVACICQEKAKDVPNLNFSSPRVEFVRWFAQSTKQSPDHKVVLILPSNSHFKVS